MVLLGWVSQNREAPLLPCANHRHHGSVNTSTTNAPIKNQTKGGDSLRCNISTNSIKNLNSFASLAVKIIAAGITSHQSHGVVFEF